MLVVTMSPAVATPVRPSSSDVPAGSTLLIDADLFDDGDELLVEEISIDGMCGVY
jgi:mycofactocin precursor